MNFKEFLEEERSQVRHNALMKALARYWRRLKYGDVRAAHGLMGFEPPEPLQPGNRVPDVTAVRLGDGLLLIGEAEAERGLKTDQTRDQWRDFHKATQDGKAEFHVIVPAGIVEEAARLAKEWGVTVHQFIAVPDDELPLHPLLG